MKQKIIIEKLILYVQKILNYCRDYDYASFADDSKLVEACVFNLSQMGELVKHLDQDFREENNAIPWKAIYGLRNRIVHDYDGVNLQLIWEIISDDLPELLSKLNDLSIQ